MTHRNGCKAMQLAQEAWDMQVPEHEDDELQLEVDRVFEEVMTDGEAYCCGETITMEQVKFMAADDFALDERIAALALDPLDSDHAMSVQRSLMLAIEAIIKGLGDE